MYDYIGGKNKTGKWIYNNIPLMKWSNYTEVFGGAMCVYLKNDIHADNVYFNDINPFITNLWRCMKFEFRDDFIEILKNTSPEMLDNRELFKAYKLFYDMEMEKEDFGIFEYPSLTLAHIMIYILTHSWSGNIVRCGCGNPNSRAIKNWETFIKRLSKEHYQRKIDKVNILNFDFEMVIDGLDDEDGCFYVDPPYWNLEKKYYTKDFPKEKHFVLAEKLKNCKSFWMLSYYEYDDLKEMYPVKDHYWRKKLVKKSAAHKNNIREYELIIFPREKYDNLIDKLVGNYF